MKRRNKLIACAIVTLILIGVVVATIKWQTEIAGEIEVKGYEFKVYEFDGLTELTFMSFGSYEHGLTNEYKFQVENIGDYNAYAYFSFNVSSEVGTFEMFHVDVWGDPEATPIVNGTGVSIPMGIMEKFELRYTISETAPRGTFSTSLTIYASDLATGGP